MKNSENEVVKKILGEVDQAVVNLDQFNAVAVAPTSYVYWAALYCTGVSYRLRFNSNPDITVDGSRLPTEDGVGKYTGSTSSEGIHTWAGHNG